MDAPTTTRAQTATAIAVAGFGFVLAALPAFLVGGLAVQIRAELGLSATAIGAAVSLSFFVSAATGPVGGALADRLGARRTILIGAGLSTSALAGIGFGATTSVMLAAFLVVGGLAVAVTDPALAVLINRGVDKRVHGLAFGIKESSIPLASLIAGVTVPVIALQFGWRWAFGSGLICLAGLAILLPRLQDNHPSRTETTRPAATPVSDRTSRKPVAPAAAAPSKGRLAIIAAATACGMAAAGGISVFLTQSAVAMGTSPSAAGVLLAAGGVAGIATRLGAGIVADRSHRQQFGAIAVMLTVGAAAMFIGAVGSPLLLTLGTLGVFSAGWGWSGLLLLSLVRAMPDAPGRAGGVGVVGLASGTASGPLVFSLVASTWSYAAAWRFSGVLALVAASIMWRIGSRLPSTRNRTAPASTTG